jgi:soluble lytic murein transglycosylase-like protein
LSEADIEAVAATAEGMRAFALIQVGQLQRAEAELRQLWPAANSQPELGRAIMLVAQHAGLPQLAAQLADLVQAHDGQPRDATRFPIPRLMPNGGFRVDPAMVYGIARTESNFNTALVSQAGATGLMQIMPDTASFLTGREASGQLRGTLRDPGFNLDLGQRYVSYLAQHDVVGGNLLKLLASYNSGPGNFGRWGPGLQDQGDPLLFIEAIPIDETRAFVPRVLTYTWIYAARMNLATPSLDELAAGVWPRYHSREPLQEASARLH